MSTRATSSSSTRPTRSSSGAGSESAAPSKRQRRTNSNAAVAAKLNRRKDQQSTPATTSSTLSAESDQVKTPAATRQPVDLMCHEELDEDFMRKIRVKRLEKEKPTEVSPEDATEIAGSSHWWKTMERDNKVLFPEEESSQPLLSESLTSSFGLLHRSKSRGCLVTAASAKRDDLLRKAESAAKNNRNEVESDGYPLDWSVKLSAKVKSKQPLDWLDFTCSTRAQFTANFVRGSEHEKSAEEEFFSGLLHWRHPAHNYPSAIESLFQKASEAIPGRPANPNNEWVRQRVEEWNEAFYSLYHSLRGGQCPYFYYQGLNFHVLFKACKEEGAASMRAFITSSSTALRKKLSEEGVDFSMPNRNAHKASALSTEERTRLQGELREMESEDGGGVRRTLGLGFADGSSDTILLVQGRPAVHSLFDFLLNLTHDKTLPTLISPVRPRPLPATQDCVSALACSPTHARTYNPEVAFEHSALRPSHFSTKRVRQGNAKTPAEDTESYVLDVDGPLLPSGVQRIVSALSQKQESFHVAFKTDTKTLTLNSADPDREVGGEGAARAVVCTAAWADAKLRVATNALG